MIAFRTGDMLFAERTQELRGGQLRSTGYAIDIVVTPLFRMEPGAQMWGNTRRRSKLVEIPDVYLVENK